MEFVIYKPLFFRCLLLFFAPFVYGVGFSQTCCSSGAPISSSLEILGVKEKSFSIQFVYEYKSINLLVDNNDRIENDARSRYGQNMSLKADYILNNKWAFSALLPFVHQSRNTFSENQNSFGPGDLTLLSQYTFYSDQVNIFNLSAGVKLPTGKINHRGPSQIFLSPDMQSGSGSFDFLIRSSYSRQQFIVPSISGFISMVYRKNGVNKNFGSTENFEGRRFAFGDEFVSIFGLRYMQTYSFGFLVPDLNVKWRWSDRNREQDTTAPNSGGTWLSLPVGLSFAPDPKKSIRLYTELPIFQNLNGLQISTNFVIGLQINYNI